VGESYIEGNVQGIAEAHGWLVRKVKWIGRVGCPDRLYMKGGRVLFIEFKRPGKDLEPRQVREIKRMRNHGVEVHVIDNIAEGLKLLGIANV
jgi:hypothetical protein